VLRTRGHYAALVTIAFGILFRNFLEVNDTLGGPQGLKIPPLTIFGWNLSDGLDIGGFELSFYIPYLLIALVLLIASFRITRNLERSWIGLSMDMVRTDEIAASTFGVNIAHWKVVAFTLGNFIAGMAGALYGMMTAYGAPNNFTFADSLILVSIVILGGIGNPWGIIPAAAIVVILPEKLQFIQEYRFLLYAIVVILILLFLPHISNLYFAIVHDLIVSALSNFLAIVQNNATLSHSLNQTHFMLNQNNGERLNLAAYLQNIIHYFSGLIMSHAG
jgi:ABC-type branched-subunit amino acid transport system permease subunit